MSFDYSKIKYGALFADFKLCMEDSLIVLAGETNM